MKRAERPDPLEVPTSVSFALNAVRDRLRVENHPAHVDLGPIVELVYEMEARLHALQPMQEMMPGAWFTNTFGIASGTLRQAARRGRLDCDVCPITSRKRYSVRGAATLWPTRCPLTKGHKALRSRYKA